MGRGFPDEIDQRQSPCHALDSTPPDKHKHPAAFTDTHVASVAGAFERIEE
jgi:hypothetical protein